MDLKQMWLRLLIGIKKNSVNVVKMLILIGALSVLASGPEKVTSKYQRHKTPEIVEEEFSHVYANLFKLKFQEFDFDPASTLNTACSGTTFTLNENGIVVGIEIPPSPGTNQFYGYGDRCNSGRSTVERQGSNGPIFEPYFYNNSGATQDPSNSKWKVWYIKAS